MNVKSSILLLYVFLTVTVGAQQIFFFPSNPTSSDECNCFDFEVEQNDYPFYEPNSEVAGYSYFWLWGDGSHTDAVAISSRHCFNGSAITAYNIELQLTPRKKGEDDVKSVFVEGFQPADKGSYQNCDPSNFDGNLSLNLNREIKIGEETVLIIGAKSGASQTNFTVNIDYTKFDLISATSGFVQTQYGGVIENQNANEFKNYYITLKCKGGQQEGTEVEFELVRQMINKAETLGNSVSLSAILTAGPYDPNILRPSMGQNLSECDLSERWITYTLQFKNEGNGKTQEWVKVLVELDDRFEQSSIEIMNIRNQQSPNWTTTDPDFLFSIEEDGANWAEAFPSENLLAIKCHNMILDGIDSKNSFNSYGYVTFKAKLKSNVVLVSGEEINGQAKVYFDYEEPVSTNIAVTSCFATSNLDNYSFMTYPNPVLNTVRIEGNAKYDPASLKLYNQLGDRLELRLIDEQTIDVSGLAKGVYYITAQSDDEVISTKIVK